LQEVKCTHISPKSLQKMPVSPCRPCQLRPPARPAARPGSVETAPHRPRSQPAALLASSRRSSSDAHPSGPRGEPRSSGPDGRRPRPPTHPALRGSSGRGQTARTAAAGTHVQTGAASRRGDTSMAGTASSDH